MTEDVEQEFKMLKADHRYEISTTEPWNFRRIGKTSCLKQGTNGGGYLSLTLGRVNGKTQVFTVHRLVALQFIDNDDPDNKTQVDHIDRNRFNNSIENLRWVTPKENYKNSIRPTSHNFQKSEYLNDLPPDSELIDEHNGYEFDRYYYNIWDERIYMETKNGRIKVVKPYLRRDRLMVTFFDINDKKVQFSYNNLIDSMKHNY